MESREDSRARDAETGQFVSEDAALDHPGLTIEEDKFMRYSPWMKEWIRLGMEMEKDSQIDYCQHPPACYILDGFVVAAVIHAQQLKRV